MENLVILPRICRPPIPLLSKRETPFELSAKATKAAISFDKAFKQASKKRDPIITDTHLNYLCKKGRLGEAITVLDAIAQRGSKVGSDTFSRLLQSCIDLNSIQLGRELHARIGLLREQEPFIDTKLVSMYSKCGYLEDARDVFEKLAERNLFTWSAMIGACSREQRWREVIELFFLMMEDGIVPDDFLFPKVLQACGNCGDIEAGKLVHSSVVRSGMSSCVRVCNAVLAMYAKCGSLSLARRFFEKMDVRDAVAWNSIISGYCQKGDIEAAQKFFDMMRGEGIEPGLVSWNILIASYSQSGKCDVALKMMADMQTFGVAPNVFTWTSLISGFAQNDRSIQALELFREMLLTGVEPSGVTLTCGISACASCKAIREGKELHSTAVKMGLIGDVLVRNSLIDMYSKCGELEAAWQVFDMFSKRDVYTWNSMIGGYCQSGYCGKAYNLFVQMQESDVSPNVVTWNVMISGYMQNGDVDQAMDIFQEMEKDGLIKRNTASWNSLIAGYLQNGQKNNALRIFRQMQSLSFEPNSVTILSVLPACANLVAAKKVKEIHGCVLRRNLKRGLPIANLLIDTYAKSGNIIYSRTIFDGMSSKDIVSWNSLISGYVLHGLSNAALGLFDEMGRMGLKPNRGTFVSIICAYSLAGMVDEGKQVFSSMTEDYKILPGLDHYSAMIDLFGRSGRLGEAVEFTKDMTVHPDSSIWASLLTASRIHGNIGLAIHAGECLLELEPGNTLIHRLILQIYAVYGKSVDSLKMKKLEKENGAIKSLGSSRIEVKNRVHTFVAGDFSKPNSDILLSWIKSIEREVKEPDICRGLCIEEEETEDIGGIHSEKIAFAFALVGPSHAAQNIRIVKKLRMCRECHRTAKFISMAFECEIYLSDSKRLHIFRNGLCSCGDYW
ncbi:pentatricopeptide repeat-containing protein At1g19720 [Malania oleifera]|uniref:pentatricopeptide repeat-containing protein At1g19720 n=1 Tax=Malania oleifera TaxID=397392 RepID=UPI0025ADC9C3|nr:pentatricopeptide repeat-containing protein At1g19720 [Malania oleifera]XP_057975795.1 pentatricopeptide repeat-containing protein At1g19720 [Malania oleifera]XP_057975796.1 pentatricopeptide repeat-containing protein At1g19720 [Malania oleifera]XP_057975797.1 pentatricopeptide repeat-containing protein At1g19720 [Malania oleifera]XP_057975798.1 pentatricopeptide repeat-containing protein At1g19720 [Malania oleifera]XP_057975799.1 pentatricopeptide repeat-containing protein At1g19720 [Malan